MADSNHGYKMIGVGKLVASGVSRAVQIPRYELGASSSDFQQPVPVEPATNEKRE